MSHPFALWLTKQPNSELPFMVVFYGGLCLFWNALSRHLPARNLFLCGVVFGLALLICSRAIGIGLVLSVLSGSRGANLACGRASLLLVLIAGCYPVRLHSKTTPALEQADNRLRSKAFEWRKTNACR
jgi:hypothetical protein